MGSYWLTTLSAIQKRDPDWKAIAAYEPPVRRFLAYRYPRLPAAERDDLLQEILLAMREKIVPGYDASAGSFRTFLRVSIANKVRDYYRRKRDAQELDEQAVEGDFGAPTEQEADALDLEAEIVRAIRRVHDRYSSGPEADVQLVYVISGVLVDGLSNRQIAKREGLSADQVKRKLQKVRGEILGEVFASLLQHDNPRVTAVQRTADLARACLREPRKASRLLEQEGEARVRDAAEAFTRRLREARSLLASAPGGEGELDLLHGIKAIFEE